MRLGHIRSNSHFPLERFEKRVKTFTKRREGTIEGTNISIKESRHGCALQSGSFHSQRRNQIEKFYWQRSTNVLLENKLICFKQGFFKGLRKLMLKKVGSQGKVGFSEKVDKGWVGVLQVALQW